MYCYTQYIQTLHSLCLSCACFVCKHVQQCIHCMFNRQWLVCVLQVGVSKHNHLATERECYQGQYAVWSISYCTPANTMSVSLCNHTSPYHAIRRQIPHSECFNLWPLSLSCLIVVRRCVICLCLCLILIMQKEAFGAPNIPCCILWMGLQFQSRISAITHTNQIPRLTFLPAQN